MILDNDSASVYFISQIEKELVNGANLYHISGYLLRFKSIREKQMICLLKMFSLRPLEKMKWLFHSFFLNHM